MSTRIKSIAFFCFFLAFATAQGQLERVFVETYYVSDETDATDTFGGGIAPGTTTYRIYVDLLPGTRLLSLFGDTDHPFQIQSTQPFFNHASDGQTFSYNFIRARYEEGTVALDTWLTLGQTGRQGPLSFYGIPKNQDTDGSFIGGTNNDGGSELVTGGLLNNNPSSIGLPLYTADGMDTLATAPTNWFSNGVLDFITGDDTTLFGSLQSQSTFLSNNFTLSNSGVMGVDPDSNQVLIAQLTTLGELEFLLNIEVEYTVNGELVTRRYVGTDIISSSNEEYNPFLSYPFACGCTDANYLEFEASAVCLEPGSCITPVVVGCMDNLACNYDPLANVNLSSSCCYPGWCNDRNIEEVCPQLKGNSFDFSVFPNPASDQLNLNVISGFETFIQYSIFNTYGNLQLENEVENAPLNFSSTIDISDLVAGIYQIKVTTSQGQQSKLFVKL